VFGATQKLKCKASCKTTIFFHSVLYKKKIFKKNLIHKKMLVVNKKSSKLQTSTCKMKRNEAIQVLITYMKAQ
jgi:hypothetical protein